MGIVSHGKGLTCKATLIFLLFAVYSEMNYWPHFAVQSNKFRLIFRGEAKQFCLRNWCSSVQFLQAYTVVAIAFAIASFFSPRFLDLFIRLQDFEFWRLSHKDCTDNSILQACTVIAFILRVLYFAISRGCMWLGVVCLFLFLTAKCWTWMIATYKMYRNMRGNCNAIFEFASLFIREN